MPAQDLIKTVLGREGSQGTDGSEVGVDVRHDEAEFVSHAPEIVECVDKLLAAEGTNGGSGVSSSSTTGPMFGHWELLPPSGSVL